MTAPWVAMTSQPSERRLERQPDKPDMTRAPILMATGSSTFWICSLSLSICPLARLANKYRANKSLGRGDSMRIGNVFVLASILALLGQSVAHADAVLTVVPPTGPIAAGQPFTVAIDVTGPTVIHSGQTITSPVSDLAAFQFDIAFNCTVPTGNATACQPGPSVLEAISVSEGSFLPNGAANITFFTPGSIDNTAGEITVIGDVGASGVTGSGDLVNVTFQGLMQGITDISILANSDLQLYDSNSNPIVVDDSVTTSPTKETFPTNQSLSASVVITPEPSSSLLLFGGIVALVVLGCGRRTRRSRTASSLV
jgi:hypothetical protein